MTHDEAKQDHAERGAFNRCCPTCGQPDLTTVLLDLHHQLTTDSDLDSVTCPEKYRALVLRIEQALLHTPYAYLCTHTERTSG